jgi:tRNA threonylcarbamoyladenosine biosynthesis protein TsaB
VLILALDTTSRAGSVAVVRDAQVLVEFAGDEAMAHGQRLPGALAEACARTGIDTGAIDLLAVAAGPGSFTGLRIGIATMQGLATALGIRIVPVSTLEATAVAAGEGPGRVAAWIDAHRGEVFAQVFERSGASAVPLADAMAGAPADVLRTQAPVLEGASFHGDGAIRYRAEVQGTWPGALIPSSVPTLAGAIGRIAAAHPDRAVLPHAVIPIYVRRPDVEMARERRRETR